MAGEVLRAWIPWAAARTGFGLERTGRAIAVIDELGDEPLLALADEDNWGPAKTVAMRMLADGIDVSDSAAVQTWFQRQPARSSTGVRP